jgi:hypothetical protein
MKSKEQIEQLAERYADGYSTEEAHASYIAFQDGYTQCQQDMQKDVEYWEGEFEHWFKQAMDMSNKYNELLNKQD